ncbi:MAG: universal stress protein, partial [Rhodoplanes sp.]
MRAAELAEQRPMPVQPLDAMIAFDPMTYVSPSRLRNSVKYSKYTIRLREGFKRILIAVDNEPVAAHAADIGMELSRELKAETALVYVIMGPSTT